MNREAVISRITEVFARLESYLRLKGRQNLNDAAVLAEDFCKDLLNRLYGHSLINLNTLDPNAAATDLIDTAQRLGFQITANATTEKIRDVHRKAIAHGIASRIDHQTILFLALKAPTEPQPSVNFTPCPSPPIVSRDLSDLISDIRRKDLAEQIEIADFLEREWSSPGHSWNQEKRISNLPFDSLGNLFIGRDAFMDDLASSLQSGGGTVIKSVQAIHGMGGVGKTRAAIEYAWRHAADFHALLFVTADGPDSLRRNLAALCAPDILNLPEHTATETDTQIAAALQWLRENRDWLLILDNVDSPETQAAVLQMTTPLTHGKILITSRLSAWPVGFSALDLDVLSSEDSLKLLLDHTAGQRRIEPDETTAAAEIARLVDGLALALEQAAAFIRKNRCSFSSYLARWHEADARLRDYQPRGVGDYHATIPGQQPQEELPRSLWVTFDTSFRLLEPPARHLLQVLSWLAPASMPVEHLDGLAAIPNANDHLADLDDLHLIRRTPENDAFSVHRLIQEILRREQSEAQPPALRTGLEWVNGLYPLDSDDIRFWPIAAPLTPHAITLAHSAADREIPEPSARLLSQSATFLYARADHRSAEPLFRRTLEIIEQSRGSDHPIVATCINNLAVSLQATNRLAEVEPLLSRARAIDEANYGPDHPEVGIHLNNLAQLLQATNRLAEAEPLMRRTLAIDEVSYGPDHPKVATDLNNLAQLLQATNRLAEAEPLMRRVIAIFERSLGECHPNVATGLNNLAQLLQATNRLTEAEPLMRRVIAIFERSLGECHPNVSTSLNNLAHLLQDTDRQAEAEPLMRRALAINEARYGTDHPMVAICLNNLASLLQATNRLTQAEPLMRRMVEIFLQFAAATGHPHPHLQAAAGNYAGLLQAMGRSPEEIQATLADLGLHCPLSLANADDPEPDTPSAALLPVLQEIMQNQEKLPEILARLQQEDPALLQQLIAFIQSQQA
jgi:tetratricopeptide (TPR) repeat protein